MNANNLGGMPKSLERKEIKDPPKTNTPSTPLPEMRSGAWRAREACKHQRRQLLIGRSGQKRAIRREIGHQQREANSRQAHWAKSPPTPSNCSAHLACPQRNYGVPDSEEEPEEVLTSDQEGPSVPPQPSNPLDALFSIERYLLNQGTGRAIKLTSIYNIIFDILMLKIKNLKIELELRKAFKF
jgi:hypothetical protein